MTRAKKLTCVRCDQVKPCEEFVNDRTRSSGKFPWCKPCVIDARRQATREDKLRVLPAAKPGERACPGCLKSLEGLHPNRLYCSTSCKDRVRQWGIYGLTPDEYRALIASNKGKCPICRRNAKKWVIDHNHATGEVTGATCSVCNQTLLAYSRHEVETAQRLLSYLLDPPLAKLFGGPRSVGPQALSQMERVKGWRKVKGYSVGMANSVAAIRDESVAEDRKAAA